MKIYFALCIWGEEYIANFLSLTIHSLFAEGNISNSNSNSNKNTLALFIIKDEQYLFENNSIFLHYKNTNNIEIEYTYIDEILKYPYQSKYNNLSIIQSISINKAIEKHYDVYFPIYSDIILSSRVVDYAIDKINGGKSAVFSCAPQVSTDAISNYIKSIESNIHNDSKFKIDPVDLTNFVINNLHPEKGPSFFRENEFKNFPTVFLVELSGYLFCKAFHLHPVAFKLNNDITLKLRFKGTLDENYVPVIFHDISRIHVVSDTSEIFMCSHDKNKLGINKYIHYDPKGVLSIDKVINIAEAHTYLIHRNFFSIDIYLCTGKNKDNIPAYVYSNLSNLTNSILSRVNMDDSYLKRKHPTQYKFRIKKRINEKIFFDDLLTQSTVLIFKTVGSNYLISIKIFIDKIHYKGIFRSILIPIKQFIISTLMKYHDSDSNYVKSYYREMLLNNSDEYNAVMKNYISSKSIFTLIKVYLLDYIPAILIKR